MNNEVILLKNIKKDIDGKTIDIKVYKSDRTLTENDKDKSTKENDIMNSTITVRVEYGYF